MRSSCLFLLVCLKSLSGGPWVLPGACHERRPDRGNRNMKASEEHVQTTGSYHFVTERNSCSLSGCGLEVVCNLFAQGLRRGGGLRRQTAGGSDCRKTLRSKPVATVALVLLFGSSEPKLKHVQMLFVRYVSTLRSPSGSEAPILLVCNDTYTGFDVSGRQHLLYYEQSLRVW